jgi:hypothetical protein
MASEGVQRPKNNMASQLQIQANRANAKLSTGPKTEQGKRTSSRNALRHGHLSTRVVFKAESTPHFQKLLSSLIEEFHPGTASEQALIETMAVSRWKVERNWGLYTSLFEAEMAHEDQNAGVSDIAARAFKRLADRSQSLHLLQRYETSLDRQYTRALTTLLKARGEISKRTQKVAENVSES